MNLTTHASRGVRIGNNVYRVLLGGTSALWVLVCALTLGLLITCNTPDYAGIGTALRELDNFLPAAPSF